MTLILTMGNRDQVIQISDRRLTIGTKLLDDESNKSGVLMCANARVIYGITGIARVGAFRTSDWLLKALHEAAPPDYSIQGIVERFTSRATEDFQTRAPFRNLSARDRRLTVMFSGYLHTVNPPVLFYVLVTNFQDFSSGQDHDLPWKEFRRWILGETEPRSEKATLIQRIGMWPAMTHEDVAILRAMLEERKPAGAIINKAVALLRRMAMRPAARKTVGRQIGSVTLLPDRSELARTDYHSEVIRDEIPMPDLIVEMHPGYRTVAGSITSQFMASDRPDTTGEPQPVIFPKVRRNAPCPCGSGRKYKWCHWRG